jgi:hypothetical protein
MIRRVLVVALAVALSACAARTPPRPTGSAAADPSAPASFTAATAACRGFRSLQGELSLSGRAAGERLRGRVLTGLEAGGSVRLEGVAPFGAPVFILAGRAETAMLLLPREDRVLLDTPVSAVLERLTGLALGADDLRLILSGCLVDVAAPIDGQQWPGGWQSVSLGEQRVAYVRALNGQPVLVAADYGPWRLDYSEHAGGFPRVVRVRRSGDETTDVTARLNQLEVNVAIDPRAFTIDVPAGAEPMTLDELRSVAPLAAKAP